MKRIFVVCSLWLISGPALIFAGTGYHCDEGRGRVVKVTECVAEGEMMQPGYSGKIHNVVFKAAIVIEDTEEYPTCPIGFRYVSSSEEKAYGIDNLRDLVVAESCKKKGMFRLF